MQAQQKIARRLKATHVPVQTIAQVAGLLENKIIGRYPVNLQLFPHDKSVRLNRTVFACIAQQDGTA
jgi:hypothetical protein